jgi:hypothetical protein
MTNGHQYQQTNVAIFIMGSKLSHSCVPNVAYSSTADDGCLEYIMLQPIKKDDEITFSYLSDIYETSTIDRQKLLWETKSFYCSCQRCSGLDYCRSVKCPICSSTVVACQYVHNNPKIDWIVTPPNEIWKCSKCCDGIDDNTASTFITNVSLEIQRKEREMSKALEIIERDVTSTSKNKSYIDFTKQATNNPTFIQEVIAECIQELSSVHYLAVKALRLLVMVSTTHAYTIIKQHIVRGLPVELNMTVSIFGRISVLAGMQLVLACECVASNCTGCYLIQTDKEQSTTTVFHINHEPQYDRATPMRHVCENILQLPIYMWPSNGLEMAYRYLPTLRVKFKNVLASSPNNRSSSSSSSSRSATTTANEPNLYEQIQLCWEKLQCLDCGTSWDSSVLSAIGYYRNNTGSLETNGIAQSNKQTSSSPANPNNRRKTTNKKKRRR